MSEAFKDVVVLRSGDPQGNRMILRLTTHQGKVINVIAVAQDWPSRTGPTWTYLFENEGLTLIDAGATGSYQELADGIEFAGFNVKDIDRVIISHGHSDHDGAAGQLAQEADAELWAHEIYEHLLPYNPWDIQRNVTSPLQKEMQRVTDEDKKRSGNEPSRDSSGYRSRHMQYVANRKNYKVGHKIQEGEQLGDLTFMLLPGHSPDEISVTLNGFVFTGDHVLPEITPHPTTKTQYSDEIKKTLPQRFHEEDKSYGLETYLRSLKRIVDLGEDVAILPAHRLYNRSKFNFQTVQRAQDIIDHHIERLDRIVRRIGEGPTPLEDVTRGVFARRKLVGGNLFMALSEIIAHIELLQDTGDLETTDDQRLCWKGTQNYKQLLHQLAS